LNGNLRPKKYAVLDERDRTFLYHLKERYGKGRALSNAERQHLFNIRQRALAFLQELPFLAKDLPEDQQAQIFTEKTLRPFIHNLVGKDVKEEKRTDRHYQLVQLFGVYGLNVCQDRLTKRNPDAFNLIVRTFNDVRELVSLVGRR